MPTLFALILLCASVATTLAATVYQLSPTMISLGGVSSITIFGSNFPDAAAMYFSNGAQSTSVLGVTIGGIVCPVIASRSDAYQLVCGPVPPVNVTFTDDTPKFALLADQSASLVVTEQGATIATAQVNYTATGTPVLSNVQHAAIPVGNMTLVASMALDSARQFRVKLGSTVTCDVDGANGFEVAPPLLPPFGSSDAVSGHTRYACGVSNAPAGYYNMSLEVKQLGYAVLPVDNHVTRTVYKPMDDGLTGFTTQMFAVVTSVTPATISPSGTLITITGNGFATSSLQDNTVTVAGYPCTITAVISTRIICRTAAVTMIAPSEQTTTTSIGWVYNTSSDAASYSASYASLGLFTPADLNGTARTMSNWTIATRPLDLEGRGTGTPTLGTASGLFIPRVSGLYRFWCTATDFVRFTLDGNEVCNAWQHAQPAGGSRFFSGLPAWNVSATSLSGNYTYTLLPDDSTVSGAIYLTAGVPRNATMAFGLASIQSYYSVAASIIPSTEPQVTSNFTVGHVLNFTASKGSAFVLALNLASGSRKQVRIPPVSVDASCATVSVAAIINANYYRFSAIDSAEESADGDSCSWIVHMVLPESLPNFTANGATLQVLYSADQHEIMYDPIPVRWLGVPFRRVAPTLSYTGLAYINVTTKPINGSSNVTTTVGGTTTASPTTTSAPTTTIASGTNVTAAPVTTTAPVSTFMTIPVLVRVLGELAYHPRVASNMVVTQSQTPIALSTVAINTTLSPGSSITIVGATNFTSSVALTRLVPTVTLSKPFFMTTTRQCTNVAVSAKDPRVVTCTLPADLPGGAYSVIVDAAERGLVVSTSPLYITVKFIINTISPATGNWNGGTIVSIAGSAFPESVDELSLIIGDQAAQVLSVTPSLITARTMSMLSAVPSSKRAIVTVQLTMLAIAANTTNATAQLAANVNKSLTSANVTTISATPSGVSAPVFTFQSSGSASITTLTPTFGSAASSQIVTATGTNLGSARLLFCISACDVCDTLFSNSTFLNCSLPMLDVARYTVTVVDTAGAGYGATSAFYTSSLRIYSVTPQVTSPYGGSTLTIAGSQFTTALTVSIGSSLTCAITFVNDTVILCTTALNTGISTATMGTTDVTVTWGDQGMFSSTCSQCSLNVTADSTTPTVSAMTPVTGQVQPLTVSGVRFTGSEVISIGGVSCPVTSTATTTTTTPVSYTLYCTIPGVFPAGSTQVTVISPPYGALQSYTYLFTLSVTSITPSTGSVGGGQLVTITGVGFSSASTVTLAGFACVVGATGTSVTLTQIVCVTSPLSALGDLQGKVVVTTNSVTASCCNYFYSSAVTPLVTRITPLTGSLGTQVNISGSRLFVEKPLVTMGGFALSGLTQIAEVWSVTLPRLPGVRGPLSVHYTIGNAWVTAQDFAVYPFINTITPTYISYGGGAMITITGDNFGTGITETVRVTVCGVNCPINATTYKQITCMAPPMRNPKSIALYPDLAQDNIALLGGTSYTEVTLTGSANLVDGDETTVFQATRQTGLLLFVGVDLGDQVMAGVTAISLLPAVGSESLLVGATCQTSVDAVTWTAVYIISHVNSGWLRFSLDMVQARYIRCVAATTVNTLAVAEMQVFGYVAALNSADSCPVVVFIHRQGTAEISTCTERPSRCISQPDAINFLTSFTPYVTQISPTLATMGSTALVTVYGSNFGIWPDRVSGVLAGQACSLATLYDDQIVCSLRPPTYANVSNAVSTSLSFTLKGSAVVTTDPFHYAEPWSAPSTWREVGLPVRGGVVTIPAGRTVVLDLSPPPLDVLIIRGTLLATPGLYTELTARAIIVDGGLFQIGTALAPHTAGFLLTLTATSPSTDPQLPLPVFGSQVLGVRSGGLAFYGAQASPAFALLSVSANTSDVNITLVGYVSWSVGDVIVIASSDTNTSHAEVRTIVSVTAQIDGTTSVVVDTPLLYAHHGGYESYKSTSVDVGAEVAVLSRSIIVTGDIVSVNQQGAVIHVEPTTTGNDTETHFTLSNVEFTACGQQPIPSADPGSLQTLRRGCVHVEAQAEFITSAVSLCTFHDTVASAIVLNGARQLELASNVVYNVTGHGIALLGGTSRFNILSGNLVFMTAPTPMSDIQASCFYVTHPNNDFTDNVAAGCTFTGFWFDLSDETIFQRQLVCPKRAPFGSFQRNKAHSNGAYGFWMAEYYATATECADPTVAGLGTATISTFKAYANGKTSLYITKGAGVSITASWFLDPTASSLAIDFIPFGTVTLRTSYFIARSTFGNAVPLDPVRGIFGISAPASEGFVISNCSFANFKDSVYTSSGTVVPLYAFRTCGRCGDVGYRDLGGFTYIFYGSGFVQSPNRIYFAPPNADIILDQDGSLLGRATGYNYTAVPAHGHFASLPNCLPPPVLAIVFYAASQNVIICDSSYRFHRFLVSSPVPQLMSIAAMTITSTLGTYNAPYVASDLFPERSGYMFIVPSGYARDETGLLLYDVNALNFTIFSASKNDWVSVTLLSPQVQSFVGAGLNISFSYHDNVVRMDVVPRYYDAYGSLTTASSTVNVIPTYYTYPGGVQSPASTSQLYLQTSSKLMTLVVLGSGKQAFTATRVLCAVTGCIFMQAPYFPPQSYSWTDVRAWRSGRVPADGEDVVIPPGMVVTLSGNTSNMRSLIVQGTLVFHPRLDAQIYAAYIVVFGGAIRSQTGHSPNVKISLLSSMNTPDLGVDETIILRPGTLLVVGELTLTGTQLSTQWTTVSATASYGDQSLSVTDAVSDWAQGSIVVISSSSRNANDLEEEIVDSVTSSGRSIRFVDFLANQHLGEVVDLSTGAQVTLKAKVGILTRNIVIDSGTIRNGSTVLFTQYGRDSSFAGRGALDSVEIRNGGFADDETVPCLEFRKLTTYSMTMGRSSVHSCLHSAVLFSNYTQGVTLSNNILYKTNASTLDMGNGFSNVVSTNLILGTYFPKRIWDDRSTPYALCSVDSRFGVNTFTANVAAGSASEGFCLQLPSCTAATVAVSGNEAHSNVNGFFLAPSTSTPASSTWSTNPCVTMTSAVAWQNSYLGIHAVTNTDLVMSAPWVYDNHFGILTGTVGAFTTRIQNAIIKGRSKILATQPCSNFSCVAETITRSCTDRYQFTLDAPNNLQGEVGLIMGTYTSTPRDAAYARDPDNLPLLRPRQSDPPSTGGSVSIETVTFADWLYGTELGVCDGAKAVTTNPFALNTVMPHFFVNVTWSNYNDLATLYIHQPSLTWMQTSMCGSTTLCDALNHVALRDLDGSFSRTNTPTALHSNYYTGALVGCSVDLDWNAYVCSGATYGQFVMQNLDDDADLRIIGPLNTQDQAFLARINSVSQPPACYRSTGCDSSLDVFQPGTVTMALRSQRTYLLDLTADVPRRVKLSYRYCDPVTDTGRVAIIVRLTQTALLERTVWSGGVPVTASTESVSYSSPAGSNYYESLDSRLYVVIPCGQDAEVHELVAASIVLTLDVSIEGYNANYAGTFISSVATFLQIDSSRVTITEVFPGSTVVKFRVSAIDSADYNTTVGAQEVNSRVLVFLTTPVASLAANLNLPVISVDSITWATSTVDRTNPDLYVAQLSQNIIIAIVCCSVAAAMILVLSIRRLYKGVMEYREVEKEITEETNKAAEMQQLAYGVDGLDGFLPPNEDLANENVRVEVGIRSLRIKVDVSDDDEEPTTAILAGGLRL